MLTRSGLGAVLSGIVLGVLGVWWGYEELVIVATAIGDDHAARHLGLATPAAGRRHSADPRGSRRPR